MYPDLTNAANLDLDVKQSPEPVDFLIRGYSMPSGLDRIYHVAIFLVLPTAIIHMPSQCTMDN